MLKLNFPVYTTGIIPKACVFISGRKDRAEPDVEDGEILISA